MTNTINIFLGFLILAMLSLQPKSYNGVRVYNFLESTGERVVQEDYNVGIKGQCVEFVKRYYYQIYNHKMPNTYGDAKDFYDPSVCDGCYNEDRGLVQHSSDYTPEKGDIVIFKPTEINPYGHIAIVGGVYKDIVLIYQQNSLSFVSVVHKDSDSVMGWLSRPE